MTLPPPPKKLLDQVRKLIEYVRLRIKGIDFGKSQIVIRDGKGMKDWVTMLPVRVHPPCTAAMQLWGRVLNLDDLT